MEYLCQAGIYANVKLEAGLAITNTTQDQLRYWSPMYLASRPAARDLVVISQLISNLSEFHCRARSCSS